MVDKALEKRLQGLGAELQAVSLLLETLYVGTFSQMAHGEDRFLDFATALKTQLTPPPGQDADPGAKQAFAAVAELLDRISRRLADTAAAQST